MSSYGENLSTETLNCTSTITAGGSVTVNALNEVTAHPGKGTLYSVVGYAPTTFKTTNSGAGVFLNKVPGLSPATASDLSNLLFLPVGASIIKVVMTNNNTTITNAGATPATFDIAQQGFSGTTQPTGNTLLNAATLAHVNSSGGCIASNVINKALGTNGEGITGVEVTGSLIHIGVAVGGTGSNLETGDCAVRIEYLI